MEAIIRLIKDVPDFPKKGIVFKDITPVLEEPSAYQLLMKTWADRYRDSPVTHFVGVESRGFLFASVLAYELDKGFVLARKPGKLPRDTISASYALEYGEDSLEMHRDSLDANAQVVIVDDLIATGGTAKAVADMVCELGAKVYEIAAVIELGFLDGRKVLEPLDVYSFISY